MLNCLSVRGRDRTQGDQDDRAGANAGFRDADVCEDKAGGMSEGMTARAASWLAGPAAESVPGPAALPVAARKFSRAYPGRPEQVGRARAFVRGVLPDDPVADDVALAVSELVTNAISHSRSREPGGLVTVRVVARPGIDLRVEVDDEGGPWDGRVRDDEHGRGLAVVAALAGETGWGVTGGVGGRTVWVRFGWPGAVREETWPAEPVTAQAGGPDA
jgi:anti-sigma regulatory factor (Ser/Thr protein kinase)